MSSKTPSHELANSGSATRQLLARTDGRTNGRTTKTQSISSVPNRSVDVESEIPGPDRWVIRKRFTFLWEDPGEYWRVSHSSIPQGHPLHGCVHFLTFEDALEYACDHAKAVAS